MMKRATTCANCGTTFVNPKDECPQCGTPVPLPIAQNNTKVEMPQPRANTSVLIGQRSGKQERLLFPIAGAAILLWRNAVYAAPLAVETGGVVYFSSTSSGATLKAVNDFKPRSPHMRVDAAQFDFIIGQVLTKAGLPLTRKE